MKASDLMTRDTGFVTRDDPLARAAQIMRDRDSGCVPVLENGGSGRLEGLITDRDIAIRHVADDHGSDCVVQHHMSADGIHTVTPDDDVSDVLEAMKQNQVRCVPVIEDGNRLVGIIAQADIAREMFAINLSAMSSKASPRLARSAVSARSPREHVVP